MGDLKSSRFRFKQDVATLHSVFVGQSELTPYGDPRLSGQFEGLIHEEGPFALTRCVSRNVVSPHEADVGHSRPLFPHVLIFGHHEEL